MRNNVIVSNHNLQDVNKIEILIDKIKTSIDSYHLGLMPAWAFAYKIEEFSKKINMEIETYDA
jgi:hypothetical protein